MAAILGRLRGRFLIIRWDIWEACFVLLTVASRSSGFFVFEASLFHHHQSRCCYIFRLSFNIIFPYPYNYKVRIQSSPPAILLIHVQNSARGIHYLLAGDSGYPMKLYTSLLRPHLLQCVSKTILMYPTSQWPHIHILPEPALVDFFPGEVIWEDLK